LISPRSHPVKAFLGPPIQRFDAWKPSR
jgi:hypothetical protein